MAPQVSDIPPDRRAALEAALPVILTAERVVLTTHVNADGDGAGCEAAMAAWLTRRGKSVSIVNPTPFPDLFRYLLEPELQVLDVAAARPVLESADLILVLDTAEQKRIGRLVRALAGRSVVVIDHHPAGANAIDATTVQDTTACATGELVYDLLRIAGDEPWPDLVARGLYAAIVTDTGSFRFANTTPRTHLVVADLLRRGVDPEAEYRRLFGTVPLRRIQLLRTALEHLEVDPDLPIAWISVPRKVLQDSETSAEDLEGVVEYARSIQGTEVALLFREADGGTKISFRSNGEVDVNVIARQFGGGGHVKASGALVAGTLDAVRAQVLDATRAAVRMLEEQGQNR